MSWPELELRWVVLGLGLLVILAVLLFGLLKPRSRVTEQRRSEPKLGTIEPVAARPAFVPARSADRPAAEDGDEGEDDVEVEVEVEGALPPAVKERTPPGPELDVNFGTSGAAAGMADDTEGAERVVSLRLVAGKGRQLDANRTLQALREAGLQHGPFDIFHYCEDQDVPESGFSVANLVEPGTFDLTDLAGSTLPGMTFFMVLPGTRGPVERFDRMVETARDLCRSLDAEMLDEAGNSWSIQGERYLREELAEYRPGQPGS